MGTPEKVADEMERWVREGDVDGFNIVSRPDLLKHTSISVYLLISHKAYALMPGTFEDVIELLIPELQRRGIFWNDYAVPGGTYRENLTETKGQREPRADHPSAALTWRAPAEEVAKVKDVQEKGTVKVNGVNGLTNGCRHSDSDEEERLDPVALQLC